MQQPSPYHEKELLTRISCGDESAFRELFERYKKRFYAVSYKMTGSDDTAKDIVQDVFIKIWKNRDSLHHINNTSAYFFTIVYRRIYQHYRKLAVERTTNKSTDELELAVNTTEEMIEVRESEQLLSLAIAQLPPQQQLVFKLSKQEGYSREDVAKYLDISPNTVKNHLARALKFINTYLQSANLTILIIMWLVKK